MILLPENDWEVKEVEKKGRGIFTKKDISPGTVIGDYLGKIIRSEDEEKYDSGDHFYSMYYHDDATIFPDVEKPGVHILNHSCAPNCWMYTYKGHTLYFSIRHIFTCEELTVSYLLSPQDKECSPCTHVCNCDSLICFDTMHLTEKRYSAWEKADREISEKTEKERIRYDKNLDQLSSYPEKIPDNPVYILFGEKDKHSIKRDDKKIPQTFEIRKIIRETGRTIAFPKLNLRIHGVMDDLLISKELL